MARKEADAGVPSYLYLFDHQYPAVRSRGLGAFHFRELPFIFGDIGCDTAFQPNWPRPKGPDNKAISTAMMDYWTSFARTGVPSAPGQPIWRTFAPNKCYMKFGRKPVASVDPMPGMFTLNEEVVSRRRRAGDQQWFANVGVAAAPPIPSVADSALQ